MSIENYGYPVVPGGYIESLDVRMENFTITTATTIDISEIEHNIAEVLEGLRLIGADPICRARLHHIETMMLDDVLKESRHLRCGGCLKWMRALLKKARGETE